MSANASPANVFPPPVGTVSVKVPGAWLALARQRSKGLLAAGLPAWIGALAVLAGLNAVALTLLALASVVLLWLYRLPPQLG